MEKNVLEKILDGIMKPADLPLQLLQNITDKFSRDRVIGEGGFGTVYKGIVGNRNVAVKRIATSMTIDEKLFYREVDSLLEVNHQNVVRFLGFCSNTVQTPMKNPIARGYIYAEIRERLLCFEYVSNGSLDKYITDELRGLEWDARFQIIKGVCAGLHYLHMEKHILHMDLKPANILLTKEMVPKITDFGLSRPSENSRTMSTIFFATPGYAAPENMVEGGRMSTKSDMYGLGALIIELVTGHKGSPDNNNILRRWRHRWNKSAKETRLTYQQQVVKCIEIGILCRENDPYKRPSISEIMSKFAEMETNHSRNANGSIIGQINSAYLEDDMLGVEPLELRFANSEQNKNNQISSQCSVELSNDTDGSIAFTIQASSPLPYSIEPNNDILKPRSKCRVVITFPTTRQDHDKATLPYKQYKEFIVRSIKVNEDLTTKDINEGMFNNHTGNVDEVHLTVVSEEPCRREVISADYSCGPLNLHTLELRFPFQPNKYIPCSLHVTNKTDEHVVFRLKEKKKWYSPLLLPLYGLVPPKSVYTLLVTIRKMEELPIEPDTDLIMQSIAIAGRDIPRLCRDDYELIEFFEQVKREKDTLDEVTIKVICAPHGEITAESLMGSDHPADGKS